MITLYTGLTSSSFDKLVGPIEFISIKKFLCIKVCASTEELEITWQRISACHCDNGLMPFLRKTLNCDPI